MTYLILIGDETHTKFSVYKKEKAASKEAARCLREQWKKECGSSYLGSIIKSQ